MNVAIWLAHSERYCNTNYLEFHSRRFGRYEMSLEKLHATISNSQGYPQCKLELLATDSRDLRDSASQELKMFQEGIQPHSVSSVCYTADICYFRLSLQHWWKSKHLAGTNHFGILLSHGCLSPNQSGLSLQAFNPSYCKDYQNDCSSNNWLVLFS